MASALEAEGFSVAQQGAKGASLTRSPDLGESVCALVLWSKASVRHDGVATDAAQAFNQNKLSPIFLQDVEPPYPYDLVPGLDATDWKGEREEPAWREIMATVRAGMGGRPPTPRPVPAPAPVAAPAPQPAPKPAPQPVAAIRAPEPAPVQHGAAQPNWFATRRVEAAAPPPRPAPPPPPPPAPKKQAEPREKPRPLPVEHETYVDDSRPKFALAPVIVGVLLLSAAALWAGPRIYTAMNGGEPPAQAAEPADPEFASVPAAEEMPAEPPAPEPQPAALESSAASGGAETAPAQPATAQPDPATTLEALEQCLGRLSKQCGPLEPGMANGFVTDARISVGEMRLLNSPLFPDRSLVTARNLNACLGAKTSAALGRACPSIAAKVNPPVVSVRPQIPEPIKAPEKPKPVVAKAAPVPEKPAPKPEPEVKPAPAKPAAPAPEPEAPKPKAIAQPEL